MLAVRGVYDGKTIKLDEKVDITTPTEIILTFLSDRQPADEDAIFKRQIKFLEQGFPMGNKLYTNREDLYER